MKTLQEIKAKSDGISLLDHSKRVADVTSNLSMKMIDDSFDKKKILVDSLYIAGLFHDIGKCVGEFQDILENGTDYENMNSDFYRHHEISWALFMRYVDLNNTVYKECDQEMIGKVIYWHHGLPIHREMNKDSIEDILEDVNSSDISAAKNFIKELLGAEALNEELDEEQTLLEETTPDYFRDQRQFRDKRPHDNSFVLMRSYLISCDRFVSSKEEIGVEPDADMMVGNLVKNNNENIGEPPSFFDRDRFDKQVDVASQCEGNTTNVIKATAGWGKTIVGKAYAFNHTDNKVMWVVPRNMVGYSVFDRIIKELTNFNKDGVVVELFLTGEVQKYYKDGVVYNKEDLSDNIPVFESDIIVTNIDNFLSPTVGDRHADKLFMLTNTSVIFDEFHELITDKGLFYCFINIMRIRHNITKADSLLLSATPSIIHEFWEKPTSTSEKTNMIPEKRYLQPQPNKKLYIKMTENNDADIFDYVKDNNSVVIYNAVRNSQKYYIRNRSKFEELLHSYYEDGVQEKKLEELLKEHEEKTTKRNLVGAPVLQASLDVSYEVMVESCLSPEATLQRIGRNNRWNEFIRGIFIMFCTNDKSEYSAATELYDNKLRWDWFKYFTKLFDGKEVHESDVYDAYYGFYENNHDRLYKFLNNKLKDSAEVLQTAHPVRLPEKKDNTITANSNVLRSNGDELFITAVRKRDGKLMEPMSIQLYESRSKQFDETNQGVTHHNMFTYIKKHWEDERFSYKDKLKRKKKTPPTDDLHKLARKSDFPYPRFDVEYDDELGLIKKSDLDDPDR